MTEQQILTTLTNPWIIAALILWVMPWKGAALWKAARLGQKYWFIALLVINTMAILEIIYLLIIAPRHTQEIMKPEEHLPTKTS
jgi:hypothetical protein